MGVVESTYLVLVDSAAADLIRVSTQTLFGLDFGFRVSTFWVLAKKPKTTFWLLRQILGKSQKAF
jgi:hypothetical protein